jgi:hypothetical protein
MALPGEVLTLFPQTVTDSLEGSNVGRGSMEAMTNLIPDPTTRRLWQCRPAAVVLIDLPPHTSQPTVMKTLGTRVYGMIKSATFPGKDEPFCFDVASSLMIPITGATAANLPNSPNAAGPWQPPHMDICGSKIIISHPGYVTVTNAFGVIDTLHQNALTYTAGTTAPVQLFFPPSWVATYGGRMFYLVNPPGQQPAAYMSDALDPLTITFANQILTFGDNVSLTCAGGLALSNQLGGIIQSLMIFKGVKNIWQVTGDYALGTLALNSLNVATGTHAPNSLCATEKGLMFMAPDGIRLIDFNATVSDPIGKDGQGVTVPFSNALTPSRACAAFNGGVYRIQVKNGAVPGNPQQEWWFDVVRGVWSGPHTTGVQTIVPYDQTFLVALQNGGSKLFRSDQVQSFNSTFIENGVNLPWMYQSTMFPEDDRMSMFSNVEATLHMQLAPFNSLSGDPFSTGFSSGFGGGSSAPPDLSTVQVQFLDRNLAVLDTVLIRSHQTGSLWGQFQWGVGRWGGAADNLNARRLAWHYPIVFKRGAIIAQGLSSSQFKIGALRLRIRELGYVLDDAVASQVGTVSGTPFTLDKSTLGGPDALG